MGLERQEGLRPLPVAIRPQANLGGASGPGGLALAPRLPSLCRWISGLVMQGPGQQPSSLQGACPRSSRASGQGGDIFHGTCVAKVCGSEILPVAS